MNPSDSVRQEEPSSPDPSRRGQWKRRRRNLLKRIFKKATLVAILAILGALAIFYYLLHHIGTYKEQD